jgi:hypothetical protein
MRKSTNSSPKAPITSKECLTLRVDETHRRLIATNTKFQAKANPGLVPLAVHNPAACG